MALWPVAGYSQVATNSVTATTAVGVAVSASATPHTMGSWVTMVASAPFAVDGLTLFLSGANTSAVDYSLLMDIGVGGAGSELVVLSKLALGGSSVYRATRLPIQIPAGVRIAARLQSAVVSATQTTGLILSGGGGWSTVPGSTIADTYGAVTGSSSGTALADTASTNVKAAWTEITSATTRRHRFLLPMPVLAAGDSSITQSSYLYDIGIGASGSEVVVIPNISAGSTSAEELRLPTLAPYRCDLPDGTRIAARLQKNVSGGEPLSLVVIGFG